MDPRFNLNNYRKKPREAQTQQSATDSSMDSNSRSASSTANPSGTRNVVVPQSQHEDHLPEAHVRTRPGALAQSLMRHACTPMGMRPSARRKSGQGLMPPPPLPPPATAATASTSSSPLDFDEYLFSAANAAKRRNPSISDIEDSLSSPAYFASAQRRVSASNLDSSSLHETAKTVAKSIARPAQAHGGPVRHAPAPTPGSGKPRSLIKATGLSHSGAATSGSSAVASSSKPASSSKKPPSSTSSSSSTNPTSSSKPASSSKLTSSSKHKIPLVDTVATSLTKSKPSTTIQEIPPFKKSTPRLEQSLVVPASSSVKKTASRPASSLAFSDMNPSSSTRPTSPSLSTDTDTHTRKRVLSVSPRSKPTPQPARERERATVPTDANMDIHITDTPSHGEKHTLSSSSISDTAISSTAAAASETTSLSKPTAQPATKRASPSKPTPRSTQAGSPSKSTNAKSKANGSVQATAGTGLDAGSSTSKSTKPSTSSSYTYKPKSANRPKVPLDLSDDSGVEVDLKGKGKEKWSESEKDDDQDEDSPDELFAGTLSTWRPIKKNTRPFNDFMVSEDEGEEKGQKENEPGLRLSFISSSRRKMPSFKDVLTSEEEEEEKKQKEDHADELGLKAPSMPLRVKVRTSSRFGSRRQSFWASDDEEEVSFQKKSGTVVEKDNGKERKKAYIETDSDDSTDSVIRTDTAKGWKVGMAAMMPKDNGIDDVNNADVPIVHGHEPEPVKPVDDDGDVGMADVTMVPAAAPASSVVDVGVGERNADKSQPDRQSEVPQAQGQQPGPRPPINETLASPSPRPAAPLHPVETIAIAPNMFERYNAFLAVQSGATARLAGSSSEPLSPSKSSPFSASSLAPLHQQQQELFKQFETSQNDLFKQFEALQREVFAKLETSHREFSASLKTSQNDRFVGLEARQDAFFARVEGVKEGLEGWVKEEWDNRVKAALVGLDARLDAQKETQKETEKEKEERMVRKMDEWNAKHEANFQEFQTRGSAFVEWIKNRLDAVNEHGEARWREEDERRKEEDRRREEEDKKREEEENRRIAQREEENKTLERLMKMVEEEREERRVRAQKEDERWTAAGERWKMQIEREERRDGEVRALKEAIEANREPEASAGMDHRKDIGDVGRALGILAKRLENVGKDVGAALDVLGVEPRAGDDANLVDVNANLDVGASKTSPIVIDGDEEMSVGAAGQARETFAERGRKRRRLANGENVSLPPSTEGEDANAKVTVRTRKSVLARLESMEMDVQECLERLTDPMAGVIGGDVSPRRAEGDGTGSLDIDQITALTAVPSPVLEVPPQDHDAANQSEKNVENIVDMVVRHEMGVSPIRSGFFGVGEDDGDAPKTTTMANLSAKEITKALFHAFREHGMIVNMKDDTLDRPGNASPASDVFGPVTVNSTPENHTGGCFGSFSNSHI